MFVLLIIVFCNLTYLVYFFTYFCILIFNLSFFFCFSFKFSLFLNYLLDKLVSPLLVLHQLVLEPNFYPYLMLRLHSIEKISRFSHIQPKDNLKNKNKKRSVDCDIQDLITWLGWWMRFDFYYFVFYWFTLIWLYGFSFCSDQFWKLSDVFYPFFRLDWLDSSLTVTFRAGWLEFSMESNKLFSLFIIYSTWLYTLLDYI